MRSQTGHAFTVVKRGFLACRGFDVFADYAGIGGSVIWRGVQIELLTQSGVRPSNVNSIPVKSTDFGGSLPNFLPSYCQPTDLPQSTDFYRFFRGSTEF